MKIDWKEDLKIGGVLVLVLIIIYLIAHLPISW
jgi:hypothetical protein